MTVDEERFNELMKQQRELARSSRKAADAESWKSDGLTFDGIDKTEFVGYTDNECEAKVLAIVTDGEFTEFAGEGAKAVIVLDKTPFYGEGGGQVGDTGYVKSTTASVKVENTTKTTGGIFTHITTVESGVISVGDTVTASIDTARRNAIRRNHTSAHLLQAALRTVLGTHVEQAGSFVSENITRFDFTHFSALTPEEISKVETLVNEAILDGIDVDNREMPIAEAKALGAMALFGEKYGDVVRVVKAGDFSTELCGGTHVNNTSKIGLFRIVSESSVAAGVRRIEAVTGANVLGLLNKYKDAIDETAVVLKSNNALEIATRATAITTELREANKKIEALEAKLAGSKINDLLASATEKNGIKIVIALLENTAAPELRTMCDKVKGDNPDSVCLFGSVTGEKLTFCAACGAEAVKRGANAGNIVREVAKLTGGNGGGKPDSAMAGGKDVSKANEAIEAAKTIIADMIGE